MYHTSTAVAVLSTAQHKYREKKMDSTDSFVFRYGTRSCAHGPVVATPRAGGSKLIAICTSPDSGGSLNAARSVMLYRTVQHAPPRWVYFVFGCGGGVTHIGERGR